MTKRKYQQKRRAEQQEETRERIIDATMALHTELGMRAATVKAIAERAGVERLTVYRHFPDQHELFAACSGKWLGLNPPPDPAGWLAEADPAGRLRRALAELYGYYRRTERVLRLSYRDREEVPALDAAMNQVDAYLDSAAEVLLTPWTPAGRELRATLRHALGFATWRSLTGQALDDAAAAALAARWVAALR